MGSLFIYSLVLFAGLGATTTVTIPHRNITHEYCTTMATNINKAVPSGNYVTAVCVKEIK